MTKLVYRYPRTHKYHIWLVGVLKMKVVSNVQMYLFQFFKNIPIKKEFQRARKISTRKKDQNCGSCPAHHRNSVRNRQTLGRLLSGAEKEKFYQIMLSNKICFWLTLINPSSWSICFNAGIKSLLVTTNALSVISKNELAITMRKNLSSICPT